MERNYQNIEDFLQDESFVNFVRGINREDAAFWKQWLIDNPHSQDLAEDAQLVIRGIPFARTQIAQEEITLNLDRLKKELGILTSKPISIPLYQKKLFRWVATIGFLLIGGYWINQASSTPELLSWATQYGETEEISLADGSVIYLNSNSTLSYSSDLESAKEKEILLEGEAYFDMKKQANGNFYSILAGELTAKVLGTSFNMNTRDSKTVLSLDEGEISLKHKEGSTQKIGGGSVAWYDGPKDAFVIEENRNKYWNSWTDEVWIFDENVTFEKILQRIENNYGMTWKVENPALLQRKLEGSVSIETLDVLLESLSYIYDIEIVRKGNTELIVK